MANNKDTGIEFIIGVNPCQPCGIFIFFIPWGQYLRKSAYLAAG